MVVPSGTEAARAFIPSEDFDSSKAFYEALGFKKLLDIGWVNSSRTSPLNCAVKASGERVGFPHIADGGEFGRNKWQHLNQHSHLRRGVRTRAGESVPALESRQVFGRGEARGGRVARGARRIRPEGGRSRIGCTRHRKEKVPDA